MITLRQSALNAMERCPYACEKEYGAIGSGDRDDDTSPTNKYARTGIVFHETMEVWGLNKMEGKVVNQSLLHEILSDKLDNEDKSLFKDEEEIEMYRESLKEQIDWIYETICCDHMTPIGVEWNFKEDLIPETLPITGTVDLITGNLDTKDVSLCDYKTGKVYTKNELKDNMQATLYALAFYKKFGFMPKEFVFYFTKHKKIKTISITPDFIARGTERILKSWYEMEKGNFKPNNNNKYFCKNFCSIYKECPAFKSTGNKGWDAIIKFNENRQGA